MNNNFLNIYNNLIKLTRNKYIFENISNKETFSDRLTIFFFHFAFFLKVYKNQTSKKDLQNLYDFVEVKKESPFFINYFNKYEDYLLKKSLNYFTKDVISHKF